jgi:antirestriction protein ArdC
LDREFGRKRWGDEGYAREELVAELGAAFLCADLALMPEPGTDHAAYIQSWLKVLRDDKRAIFAAAAHAQRAADFLHSLQARSQAQIAAAAEATAKLEFLRLAVRPAASDSRGGKFAMPIY